ncbi:MAG: hypothetical protein M3P50_05095, partial [Actinomycetota bacterium]|nr:hypothetical protein [Actinomycetota bacterium]
MWHISLPGLALASLVTVTAALAVIVLGTQSAVPPTGTVPGAPRGGQTVVTPPPPLTGDAGLPGE